MNQIEVALPFTEEQLDAYFETIDEHSFLINLEQSTYKGQKLLNYIYNTGMTCDILIDKYNQDVINLLICYIKTDKIISIPILNRIWVDAVHHYIVRNSDLDSEYKKFIDFFVSSNEALIEELASVLYCLKMFLLNIVFEADLPKEEKEISEIGHNIVSLREDENFWPLLAELDNLGLSYYVYPIFSSTVYDGYKIAHFFFDEFTPLSILRICADEISKEQNEADSTT